MRGNTVGDAHLVSPPSCGAAIRCEPHNHRSLPPMSRPQRKLTRDEVRLGTGTIERITADDIWVEITPPLTEDTRDIDEFTIEERYTITDIVTDAVRVVVHEADDQHKEETVEGDYSLTEFRENAAAGELVPETALETETTDQTPDAEEIMHVLSTAVNHHNVDAAELMEKVDSEHNYLQAEVFEQVVKPLIIAVATTPQYDARNTDARKTARNISDAVGWELPEHRVA